MMNGNVLEMSMHLCLMTIKIIQLETGQDVKVEEYFEDGNER